MSAFRSDCYNPLIDDSGFEMDIITAASVGDARRVHRLVTEGADAAAVNGSGWTPLMYAAHYGHFGVVRVLINAGVPVDQREWSTGRTALMMAAANGHTKCLSLLVREGRAALDAVDKDGKTAAFYARTHGHGNNQIVRELLHISSPKPSGASVPPVLVTEATPRRSRSATSRISDTFTRVKSAMASGDSRRVTTRASPAVHSDRVPSSPKKSRVSRDKALASCKKRISFEKQQQPPVGVASRGTFLPSSLQELLQRLGLSHYESLFAQHNIDLYSFPDLSDEELLALGIEKLGDRKRLAAAQLRLLESVEISSVQECLLADFLLMDRRRLQKENDKLRTFILEWRDAVNQAVEISSQFFDQMSSAAPAVVAAPDSSSSSHVAPSGGDDAGCLLQRSL